MAITPFVFAPFGNASKRQPSPEASTELSFTKNFDISKPAVMVFFAHGHYATLEKDVVQRQQVLKQLEGLNAVLVAPQLGFNKKDSSPGRFSEDGFAKKFFDEAALKLAQMHDHKKYNTGKPSKETLDTFRQMPIMMVSYSGGYGASLAIMEQGMREIPKPNLLGQVGTDPMSQTLGQRIKGAVLLDTLYGGGDTIKRFAAQPHQPFVISNYIPNKKNNLTMNTNLDLQTHFGLRHKLASGSLNDKQNVKIYQASVGHSELVERGLTRALHYVPGYRVNAPEQVKTIADNKPDKKWHIGNSPTTTG